MDKFKNNHNKYRVDREKLMLGIRSGSRISRKKFDSIIYSKYNNVVVKCMEIYGCMQILSEFWTYFRRQFRDMPLRHNIHFFDIFTNRLWYYDLTHVWTMLMLWIWDSRPACSKYSRNQLETGTCYSVHVSHTNLVVNYISATRWGSMFQIWTGLGPWSSKERVRVSGFSPPLD